MFSTDFLVCEKVACATGSVCGASGKPFEVRLDPDENPFFEMTAGDGTVTGELLNVTPSVKTFSVVKPASCPSDTQTGEVPVYDKKIINRIAAHDKIAPKRKLLDRCFSNILRKYEIHTYTKYELIRMYQSVMLIR